MLRFKTRVEAGEQLAYVLAELKLKRGVVLGIPRGGVVVAKVVAEKLGWPMGVIVTKKLGYPNNPELAVGAVAEEGEPVWDERFKGRIDRQYLKEEEERVREKIKGYVKKFRNGIPLCQRLRGIKTVVLIDDGIATGMTMEAAIKYLQGLSLKVVVAVPVAAKDTEERLKPRVDKWVSLYTTDDFWAVGQFYEDFPQVADEEVIKLLQ